MNAPSNAAPNNSPSAVRPSSVGDKPAGRGGFGTRLQTAMRARGPLCVGIDPHPGLLTGWDLPVTVAGLERFAMTAVEALAPEVAVLKPQSAFFEAYGSAGIAVLERVLAVGREAGALMLLDVKRGDIGSTMAAYAAAYLADGSPLAADAVTVSPYLGFGSLRPALDLATATGRGIFVLSLTSNSEGAQIQRAVSERGTAVAQEIVDAAGRENAVQVGPEQPGSPDPVRIGPVGVVIGATHGETGLDLSRLRGPILAPGLGAQGATARDLRAAFGDALPLVLPATSRDVLRAGPSAVGLVAAARRTIDEVRAALA